MKTPARTPEHTTRALTPDECAEKIALYGLLSNRVTLKEIRAQIADEIRAAERRGAEGERKEAVKMFKQVTFWADYVSVIDGRANDRLMRVRDLAAAYLRARTEGKGER